MTRPSQNPSKWIFGAAVAALPAAVWLLVLARNTFNIPSGDDHFSLLPFINAWKEAGTLAEMWRQVTGQFISHRIVVTKCVAVVDWWIFGELNFVALQVVGWIGWLAVAGGLSAITPAIREKPLLALPLALLLFQPIGYSNLLVAVGMGNTWVIAFALLAAICAFSDRPATAAAVLFAVASALSFVNGLLVFPALVLGLIAHRRFDRAVAIGVAGILTWSLYLQGYHHEAGPVQALEIARKAAIMTGGMLQIARAPDEIALWGGAVILLSTALLLSRRRFWREMPVHATFLGFVVFSVFTAARGRAGWDDYYMLQDRYRIYGLLMLAIGWLVLVQQATLRRKTLTAGASLATAVFCVLSYTNLYSPLNGHQNLCAVAAPNWQLGECVAGTMAADWPLVREILHRSEKLGTYRLPALLEESELNTLRGLKNAPLGLEECALLPNGGAVGYTVCPPVAAQPLRPGDTDFGVLFVHGRPVILPVVVFRVRLPELFQRCSVLSDRFGLTLPKSEYTVTGRHAVYGLKRTRRDGLRVVWSGSVTLP